MANVNFLAAIISILNRCEISNFFTPQGARDYVRYYLNNYIVRVKVRTVVSKLYKLADGDKEKAEWKLAEALENLPISYWYFNKHEYLTENIHDNDSANVFEIGVSIKYEYENARNDMGIISDHLELWGEIV